MNKITLGKTNLVIEKNGFGCLPIQRIREQDAVDLLHKAYDGLSLIHISEPTRPY